MAGLRTLNRRLLWAGFRQGAPAEVTAGAACAAACSLSTAALTCTHRPSPRRRRSIPIYRQMQNGRLPANEFCRSSQASNEAFKEGLSKLSKWQTKHFGIPNCIDASPLLFKISVLAGEEIFPCSLLISSTTEKQRPCETGV